jgi:hypothetical protein
MKEKIYRAQPRVNSAAQHIFAGPLPTYNFFAWCLFRPEATRPSRPIQPNWLQCAAPARLAWSQRSPALGVWPDRRPLPWVADHATFSSCSTSPLPHATWPYPFFRGEEKKAFATSLLTSTLLRSFALRRRCTAFTCRHTKAVCCHLRAKPSWRTATKPSESSRRQALPPPWWPHQCQPTLVPFSPTCTTPTSAHALASSPTSSPAA